MSVRRKDYRNKLRSTCEDLGLDRYEIREARKLRITLVYRGRSLTYFCSSTPSCPRALPNAVAGLRKLARQLKGR